MEINEVINANLECPKIEKEFIVKDLNFICNSTVGIEINPILCEIFVNKNFKSNYLNLAECITIKNNTVTLTFNKSDGKFIKSKKNSFTIINECLKNLVKAIFYLHSHRILHGNININNLLIFNSFVKLSDFSYSSLILNDGNQKYNNKLYLPTHRAPEVWKENEWGFAADIWALGCTIFEILYGRSFFKTKSSSQDYIDQINNWSNCNELLNNDFKIPSKWNKIMYHDINILLLKMLNPDPKKRPTIFEIINDRFFQFTINNLRDSNNLRDYTNNEFSLLTDDCKYHDLSLCPIVDQRIYEKKTSISKINSFGLTDNIELLSLFMYESFPDESIKKNDLIKIIIIIVNLLSGRNYPSFFTITRDDIINISKYSVKINFNYINWSNFYRNNFLLNII